MKQQKLDLQDRLIQFSIVIMEIVERMPKAYTGQHFAHQLVRSGTSPAFHYGEAQAAESKKDFIHKMKISLKELRETFVCLTIIQKKPLLDIPIVDTALIECNELISITFSSITTAQSNLNRKSI